MDPINCLHLHVHDLVFQHLFVKEILECSLVSKCWNKSIGRSSRAMKEVWLNVGDRFNEPKKEDLRAFRASERKYQNFKISEIENGLQILLFPKRRWQRAQIDIQSFTTYKDYVNLLRIFHESVVELDLFDMDIEDGRDINEVVDFPSLNKLKIGFVSSIALRPFLSHIKSLDKLVLENISDMGSAIDNSNELMLKFVHLQPQLAHLSLTSEAFIKIFENAEMFNFQLTYLLIDYNGKRDTSESKTLLENFDIFIINQKQLQWITLCKWTCEVTVSQIISCSNINRVSFDYYEDSDKFDSSSLELKVNENIKQLDFDFEDLNLDWLKPIFKAAPKTEILYFFHVSQELLQYLLLNFKHLKTLEYCSIFDEFKEFYSCMKKYKSKEINLNVEIKEKKFLDLRRVL